MDITVARTFLEVVRSGSFVGAAANLNVTQTAVAARIRALESELERPLFVRNKAGARLTSAGAQFQRFAATMVQVWERARYAVALPPGRESVVTLGAELALGAPFLSHWLLWMRRECPELAVRVEIASEADLMDQVQNGALDIAVLYAAPRRPGVVCELLFAEQLVKVRTTPITHELGAENYAHVEWGEDFAMSYGAAFPDSPNAVLSSNYGPLALDYILAVGGSGYFRRSIVAPYLEEGRLVLAPESPQFGFSAFAVHSTQADESVLARAREGLRAAARLLSSSDA